MFERIANKFQTIVLVGLVVLLSLVFVLQFGGPQADGCTSGGATFAVQVHGETISDGDFRAAYLLAGFNRYPVERQRSLNLREAVLNGFIERGLLANEAREMGFVVTEADVMKTLAEDGTIRLTLGSDASPYLPQGEIPVSVKDEDGNFDPEQAKRLIQNYLRRSISEFAEGQIEEQLAQRVRETVVSSVQVSPSEIWDAFVREKDRAQIDYVRFSPAYYRNTLQPTDAELGSWMGEHTEEVDREFEANRHRFTDLEPQVRARHILIKASADASEDLKTAARARAEGLRARIMAGEDFAALAREFSEDPGSGARGGDLGYNPRGRMVGPFDESQFGLDVDEVSELVETRFGFHIIKVVGKREGDVPEDEAKRELADRLYREARSGEMAEQAARAALTRLRGGESMEELDDFLAGRVPPAPTEEVEAVEGAEPVEGEEAPAEPEEEEEEDRDPLAPQVRESREFGTGDTPIQGPFDSSPLVRATFDLSMESPLPEEPIQLGQEWVVFNLKARTVASRDDFTPEERARLTQGLLGQKQREVLNAHIASLRVQAERDQAIRVNSATLLYGDEVADDPEAESDEESEPAGDDS